MKQMICLLFAALLLFSGCQKPVSPSENAATGAVVFADKRDPCDWNEGNISAYLARRMEAAPANARFRILVSDPAYQAYLREFTLNGYRYGDFLSGELKSALSPEDFYTKKAAAEAAARQAFFEILAEKYQPLEPAAPAERSETSMDSYQLLGTFDRTQIKKMAAEGCNLSLALPENTENAPGVITDGLNATLSLRFQDPLRVLIVLDIDNSQRPHFNHAYYQERIQTLTYEQLSLSHIEVYLSRFIEEHPFLRLYEESHPMERQAGLFIDPYQTVQPGQVQLSDYSCSAALAVSLPAHRLQELARDPQVRVIDLACHEEPPAPMMLWRSSTNDLDFLNFFL